MKIVDGAHQAHGWLPAVFGGLENLSEVDWTLEKLALSRQIWMVAVIYKIASVTAFAAETHQVVHEAL